MLRVRDIVNKKAIEIPKNGFVEICNGVGELLYVLHVNENEEIVNISKGTPQGFLYSKLTGINFSKHNPKLIKTK